MKLEYLLLCDAGATTEDGKVILHGIFDKINTYTEPTEEKPIVHPSMSIAYRASGKNSEHFLFKIAITSEKAGKEIFAKTIENPNGDAKVETVAGLWNINLLSLPALGTYRVSLYVDDELVGERQFEIALLKR